MTCLGEIMAMNARVIGRKGRCCDDCGGMEFQNPITLEWECVPCKEFDALERLRNQGYSD